jgi:O-antigen ligase
MAEERFSLLRTRFNRPLRRQSSLSTTEVVVFIAYLLLNLGCVLLMTVSLMVGIVGVVAINLLVFLLLRPQLVVPLYVLIAGPSVIIPLGTSGVLSRLYGGILLLALLIVIGCLRIFSSHDKFKPTSPSDRKPLLPASLIVPLIAVVLVGLASIIYSWLNPDPTVVYSFRHANVPLILVNAMEMALLLGLPLLLFALPGLIRTSRDVELIVRAFIGIGILYALGTIFAMPLGLYSQEVILGNTRPQVFGEVSSALGMLLVLFASIALGQALYAQTQAASFFYYLCTAIFGMAVIMSLGRESWLALGLSILIIITFRTKNISALSVLVLLLPLMFIPGVTDFFNPDKVYGIDRLIMWQDAFNIWQQHPYFGVGAGNYQFFDVTYGLDVGGFAHNQLLEVLAEMGVQGLFCLLWSIIAIGRFTFRRFQTARTSQGKAITIAYIGCYFALILGLFFGDSFLPSVALAGGTYALIWVSYFWLPLGLVLTLPQWEKSEHEPDQLPQTAANTYSDDLCSLQGASQAATGRRSRP